MFNSPLTSLAFFVATLLALYGSCYLGAVWLRLAARILKMPEIPYRKAFTTTLIANACVYGINFTIGFNATSLLRLEKAVVGPDRRDYGLSHLSYFANPTFMLYSVVLGLFLTACIYRRLLFSESALSSTVSASKESTVSHLLFADYFVLASLTLAINTVVIGLIVYTGIVVMGLFTF